MRWVPAVGPRARDTVMHPRRGVETASRETRRLVEPRHITAKHALGALPAMDD